MFCVGGMEVGQSFNTSQGESFIYRNARQAADWTLLPPLSPCPLFATYVNHLQNYLLGRKETSEMADRNKEALLEVRCQLSHFDYAPDILLYLY